MSIEPHVVAVVLDFNGREQTLACLSSLSACDWPRLSPLVVDNASEPEVGPSVWERFPDVPVLRNEVNLGFTGGMNRGIGWALERGADYLLLLNNDTLLDPAAIRLLVDAASSRPDAGIVCPLVLWQDRPEVIQSAGLRCDLRRVYNGAPIGANEVDRGQYRGLREVDAAAGAAMLVPSAAIAEAGMLDERLFMYGEDVEWAARMRQSGRRVYVFGGARVWHGHSTASGGANSPLSAYYLTRNSLAVSARVAPLPRWLAGLRSAGIVAINLGHARRAQRPTANVRAVLAGMRDARRGHTGAAPPESEARWFAQGEPGGRRPPVVVSAGFHKTHMTTAAAEVHARGHLAGAITGAYPTAAVRLIAARIGRGGRWGRLLDRSEAIPSNRLRSLTALELAYEVTQRLPGPPEPAATLCARSLQAYGRAAASELERLARQGRIEAGSVYHFRAGFGHASIDRARGLGMHVLCDHAIVHPEVLESLIASRGRSLAAAPPRSPVDRAILADIEAADSVLVNSEFVKQTFLACGWAEERLHVVYLGVDENFLRLAGEVSPRPQTGPLRLLFAGRFERRKGADVLVEALAECRRLDWELVIAGPVTAEISAEHGEFLADRRVRVLGALSREQVAREMSRAPVLVLPSYAEGSARVAFEALACGCYVICTPNSGTIVQDGVHGAIVAPGDPTALAGALTTAAADRVRLAEIGTRNAALVRSEYRQRHYGEALLELYRELRPTHQGARAVLPTVAVAA